ncbi:cupin domain-containing protein [Streptococcus merionis]|uniref:cupin domain-containing protein n=1 Tax=Streptococcus merionis TaxID=400065 RepID=UPI0026F2869D|nr:cupin domain-containing protein [Streptococcus merionis]
MEDKTFEQEVKNDIFGFGNLNTTYADYFSGDSFLKSLVQPEGSVDVAVANVSFAPGTKNNWHVHTDGFQIILVTSGKGWAQIDGQPKQTLKPGDVVIFPAGVKHWHGATDDTWFSHLAITKGATKWLAPVKDTEI